MVSFYSVLSFLNFFSVLYNYKNIIFWTNKTVIDGDIAISEQQTIHEKAPEVEFVFSEKVRSTEINK